jgi:hypothetical protein
MKLFSTLPALALASVVMRGASPRSRLVGPGYKASGGRRCKAGVIIGPVDKKSRTRRARR